MKLKFKILPIPSSDYRRWKRGEENIPIFHNTRGGFLCFLWHSTHLKNHLKNFEYTKYNLRKL